MNSPRRYSLAAGLFYILTFVSIPALGLYGAVRGPAFVVSGGPDAPVMLDVVLEMIVALAVGRALAAQYRWTFFFAQSFIPSWFAVLLGVVEALSPIAALAALPIAVWELSLGVYLTFRGFRDSPILAGV
jgi:hypothetical protein